MSQEEGVGVKDLFIYLFIFTKRVISKGVPPSSTNSVAKVTDVVNFRTI